ncbi:MAG TPA: peptidoglycan-binding protein, partial [Chthoniobacterales bacterium]
WLLPAGLAALLTIPFQTAAASGMGGGHGGGGGGHGIGGMGGMGRGGFGGRGMMMHSRPAMGSRFFSRSGTNGLANHQNLASRNRDFNRFNGRTERSLDRQDHFRDSHGLADRGVDRADRFRDNHFDRDDRFNRFDRDDRFGRFDRDDRRFFFNHNFFVGFNFGAFGWWPGWWGWGWGGPWWWGWDGWAYPYGYCDYGYPYGYDYSATDDPPPSDSQYGSKEYWSDLAMSVQNKLTDDGYYHGQIDGVLGSSSLEAIRQFQSDHGLVVNGKIDPKLLDALGIKSTQQISQLNADAGKG